MLAPQPAAPQTDLPNWCQALDRVHDYLEEILTWLEELPDPPIDLTPAGQRLQDAYLRLYELLSLNSQPHTTFDELKKAIDDLHRLLVTAGSEPHLMAAATNCQLAAERLESARPSIQGLFWTGPASATPMKATHLEPRLHRLNRAPLVPKTAFAPPPATEMVAATLPRPKPKDFAEMREAIAAMRGDAAKKHAAQQGQRNREATNASVEGTPQPPAVPGLSSDPPPVLTEDEFRRERARETFEEIAMIGMHRLPLLGDPWRGSLVFEQRMFESLDALVALGPIGLTHLDDLTLGSQLKDPARLFALTLVTGCVDGRDTLALAERYFMREYATDPAYTRAFINALRMVPHPWVEPRCRALLASEHAIRRRVALDVLAYRKRLSVEELHQSSCDDPEVAAVALPYFAMHDHPKLIEVLEQSIRRYEADVQRQGEQQASLDHHQTQFRGLATALAMSDHPEAHRFFWRHSRGKNGDYATLMLGVTANRNTADDLLEQAASHPTPTMVTALSWAGPTQAVPLLIGLLESSKDEELRSAAAYGLERLTAGGFIEEAQVPPEALEDPDLPDPDVGDPPVPSLSARVSLPIDAPADGSPDLLERPSTDPAPWRKLWEREGPRFTPEQRIRRGMRYSPLVSLDELDRGHYVPAERRTLVLELIVRTGRWVPVDPEDLVLTQERALAQWRDAIADKGRTSGGWDRARNFA
ncbi:MAG TPA: hypothetical protein VKP30_19125 [Polyangiaceae bacterium]|nr:hypothetical protein [Polyangiaceae bacterium]